MSAAESAAACGEVSAAMASAGHDVQGIPWASIRFARTDYRSFRLRENVPGRSETVDAAITPSEAGADFARFVRNTRRVQSSIFHNQLRNLVAATSESDVYTVHDSRVLHWDAAASARAEVVDLDRMGRGTSSLGCLPARRGADFQKSAESARKPSAKAVQPTTIAACKDLVVVGGTRGEVVAKRLSAGGGVVCCRQISAGEDSTVNSIDLSDSCAMVGCNNCSLRRLDLATFAMEAEFTFEKPVNHATRQAGGKMVAAAGDEKAVTVLDGDSGEVVEKATGHDDFCFATAWHPGGMVFATGSDDCSARVWDVRRMDTSLFVLGANMGPVRSVRFSSCGRFLVFAEAKDFVHLYDVSGGKLGEHQEIDLFGEIAGISISPGAERLFVGTMDASYGSLLEYSMLSLPQAVTYLREA